LVTIRFASMVQKTKTHFRTVKIFGLILIQRDESEPGLMSQSHC